MCHVGQRTSLTSSLVAQIFNRRFSKTDLLGCSTLETEEVELEHVDCDQDSESVVLRMVFDSSTVVSE